MAYAGNYLRTLLENPGSHTGTPGYQFARDQALQATSRSMPGMRGSGNVLAALQRTASGLASQDYGNQVDRVQRAAQMEQQGTQFDSDLALRGELGRGELDLGRGRLDLEGELGRGRLGLDRDTLTSRTGLDRDRLALDTTRAGQDFEIAGRGLDNQREGNWWDYDINRGRNALQASQQENDFNTAQGRLGLDWFGAQTARGTARSQDWERRDAAARGWQASGPSYRDRYEDRRPAWARGY